MKIYATTPTFFKKGKKAKVLDYKRFESILNKCKKAGFTDNSLEGVTKFWNQCKTMKKQYFRLMDRLENLPHSIRTVSNACSTLIANGPPPDAAGKVIKAFLSNLEQIEDSNQIKLICEKINLTVTPKFASPSEFQNYYMSFLQPQYSLSITQ